MDILEVNGGSGAAFDAHLLFFVAGTDARIRALHQKGRELLAADFCKHREQIGCAAVGDPHFLSIEDVVFSIGAQIGARFCGESIRSRVGFGQRVSGDEFCFG